MDRLALAYTAGLFDGRGQIHYKYSIRRTRFLFWIDIASTRSPMIATFLKNAFGGYTHEAPLPWRGTTTWRWTLSRAKAFTFLRLIAPYLKAKHAQVDFLLQWEWLMRKIGMRTAEDRVSLRMIIQKNAEFNKPTAGRRKR